MSKLAMLGRGFQQIGLVALPLGIVLELLGQLGRNGLAHLLLIMVFGVVAFQIGRYIEGYAQHSQG